MSNSVQHLVYVFGRCAPLPTQLLAVDGRHILPCAQPAGVRWHCFCAKGGAVLGQRPELLLGLLTLCDGEIPMPSLAAVAGGEGSSHGFLLLSSFRSIPPSSAGQ